jgi:hypothetical protein
VGEKPGLSGAAFFDLYTGPREEGGKMLPTFPAKGMFNVRTVRGRCTPAPNRRA